MVLRRHPLERFMDNNKKDLIKRLLAPTIILVAIIMMITACHKDKEGSGADGYIREVTDSAVRVLTPCREQYMRTGTPAGCDDCAGKDCAEIDGVIFTCQSYLGNWHELKNVALCGCLKKPKPTPTAT